jgi:hypothetical protein
MAIFSWMCLMESPTATPQETRRLEGLVLKTESFDRDPNWLGVNNRIAQERQPIAIRQDFGFSAKTSHAGGDMPGEIGGFVTPAGEAAFYGKDIGRVDFDQALSASGRLTVATGGTHLLIGFFNSETVNEWRTPNSVAIRLNGRGERFFAYVEYCNSKWRAGGDTTPFPSTTDPKTGRWNLIGYPCDKPLSWTLTYDPKANGGQGVVTATIGNDTAICKLDDKHKLDGATFNRFGILNVAKSADSGSEVWFDDIAIQGEQVETFSRDPMWDGRNNRSTYRTRLVRPWFDFGYCDSQFAGGEKSGELGGRIFRGDCREPSRMACSGDRVGPLSLERRLKAQGRIALRRGVSDSTTLFGFYDSKASMRTNDSQNDSIPASVLGIHVEGPSSEGFKFYPVLHPASGGGIVGNIREFPTLYPDGQSHQWSLDYYPPTADAKGRINITLDRQSATLELPDKTRLNGTIFDRFGIITSWIDGNSQDVYWDDITYTVRQE